MQQSHAEEDRGGGAGAGGAGAELDETPERSLTTEAVSEAKSFAPSSRRECRRHLRAVPRRRAAEQPPEKAAPWRGGGGAPLGRALHPRRHLGVGGGGGGGRLRFLPSDADELPKSCDCHVCSCSEASESRLGAERRAARERGERRALGDGAVARRPRGERLDERRRRRVVVGAPSPPRRSR